jgi:hypothetical protein
VGEYTEIIEQGRKIAEEVTEILGLWLAREREVSSQSPPGPPEDEGLHPVTLVMSDTALHLLCLAGQHLDPDEGGMTVGHVVTLSDVQALRRLLGVAGVIIRKRGAHHG